VPDWDKDSPQLRENLNSILTDIVDDATRRVRPSRDIAREWQRLFLKGLDVPDTRYVGAYRGERGLERTGVRIGNFEGMVPSKVSEALTQFESTLRALVEEMDLALRVGQDPNADQLGAVVDICAWAHAEWVRIHPFANGNGRTARLWANWIAVRYGLPPFVRLRPRPDDGYSAAGAQAMQGNWKATVEVFKQLLGKCLSDPTSPWLN